MKKLMGFVVDTGKDEQMYVMEAEQNPLSERHNCFSSRGTLLKVGKNIIILSTGRCHVYNMMASCCLPVSDVRIAKNR